jgi:hydrogenase maturation protein HypF
VAWDGNGYGLDGTMWGGEFFGVTEAGWERVAYFRPFPLPGGERAIVEPRRAAFGLLYAMFGAEVCTLTELASVCAFPPQERRIVRTMLDRGLQSPLTSSVGRLFDAVASIIGLRQDTTFEGQAAMDLEFALDGVVTDRVYPWRFDSRATATVIDWAPMMQALLTDLRRGLPKGQLAAVFHNTLAEIIVAVATRQRETRVVLTGGCFQNRYLTERSVTRLRAAGRQPFWHHLVPPNDGGIAVGQVAAALRLALEE